MHKLYKNIMMEYSMLSTENLINGSMRATVASVTLKLKVRFYILCLKYIYIIFAQTTVEETTYMHAVPVVPKLGLTPKGQRNEEHHR